MTSGIPRTLVGARSPGGNLDSPPHPHPHAAAAAALVVAPTSEWKQFQAQHGGAILPGVGSVQYHADHGSHSSTAASENSEKRKRKQLDHHEGAEEDITKPYECRFCPMKFAKSQALGGHMNRHRQEREREQYMHARQLVMQQQPAAFSSWMLSAQNNSAAAAAAHTPGSFSRFTGQFAQQRDQASQAAGLNLQRYSSAAAGVSTSSVPAAVPPPAAANFFLHSSGSAGSNFQQSWQGLLAQPIAAVGGAASANLLPDNTRSSLQAGNTVSSFPRDADQMMQVPGSSFSQTRPSLGISYGTFNTQLSSRGATSGNAFGQDHLAQGSSPYGLEQRSPLDGGSFMQSNLSVGSGQHIGSLSKHGASSGQATPVASDSKRPSAAHALNLPSIVGAAASGTQLQGQFGSFQADQLQSLQSDHISNSQFNILPVAAGGYGQTFFPGTSFGSMQPGSSQSDFLNQHSSVFESLQGPATFNNMLQFSGTCKSLNMNPMGSSGEPGSVIEGTGGSFNLASLQGAAGQAVQEHMQLSGNNIQDVDSGSLHSPQSRAHPAASHGQGGSGGTTHHHGAAASPDHHQLAIAQHQSNSPINAGAEHERQSSQLQQLDASIDQPTLQETLYRYQSDPDMISTSACCNHHANCDCRSSRYKQHEGHDIKVEFQPPAAASGSHPHDPSSATTSPPPPPPPTSTSQENAHGR